jgi:hypothetical protein
MWPACLRFTLALVCGLTIALGAPKLAWSQGAPAADALRIATAQVAASDPALKAAGHAALAALAEVEDPRIAGAALYQLGVAADSTGDHTAAIARYASAVQRDPGGGFARQAHRRLERLRAVPDEDRAALAEMEALLRTDPSQADRSAVAAGMAALLVRARSPQLRGRLLRWQTEEALAQGHRDVAFQRALATAAEPGQAPLAVRVAFERALVAGGDEQLPALAEAIETRMRADPALAETADLSRVLHEVADRQRRMILKPVFICSALLLLAFSVWSRAWRALRIEVLRSWRPWRGLLFLAWAFGAAALLAGRFEPQMGLVVGACGVAVAPVQVLAGAIGQMRRPESTWLRLLLGLAITGSTLGACYVVLARTGRQALMGV